MTPHLIVNADPLYSLQPVISWDKPNFKRSDLHAVAGELLYAELNEFAVFDSRLIKALEKISINTVHQLAGLSRIELLKAPGIGKKGRAIVCRFLIDHGLSPYSELANTGRLG